MRFTRSAKKHAVRISASAGARVRPRRCSLATRARAGADSAPLRRAIRGSSTATNRTRPRWRSAPLGCATSCSRWLTATICRTEAQTMSPRLSEPFGKRAARVSRRSSGTSPAAPATSRRSCGKDVDVFAHNVEVVPELQRAMRMCVLVERSLEFSDRHAPPAQPDQKLRSWSVAARPASRCLRRCASSLPRESTCSRWAVPASHTKHADVVRYVLPAEFDEYRRFGLEQVHVRVAGRSFGRATAQRRRSWPARRRRLRRGSTVWSRAAIASRGEMMETHTEVAKTTGVGASDMLTVIGPDASIREPTPSST